MERACLLTGAPGTGKTTIIREALSKIRGRAGGFYTQEIRRQGIRQGFEIVTLAGQKAILAHIDLQSPFRVSKYGVDIDNLEQIGVSALRQATREDDIVVVDEIGKMELFSAAFREAVLEALDSGKKVLGTIILFSHPWADQIKHRPEVEIALVTRENRQQVLERVARWLGGSGCGPRSTKSQAIEDKG